MEPLQNDFRQLDAQTPEGHLAQVTSDEPQALDSSGEPTPLDVDGSGG